MSKVDLKLRRVLDTEGKVLKGARPPKISDQDLQALYRTLVLTREFDNRMLTLQRQGRLAFYLTSTGEEACAVGGAYALKPEEWVFPCYREAGLYHWRGVPLVQMAAQCYGRKGDPTQGRQMPAHYSFREYNLVSVSSPVGTQIIQAAGAGWAEKLQGGGRAVLVYFGDGATSQGDFHRGLNFAAVYQAPTVFFCRNNGWAISTPMAKQMASETVAQKATAYGLPAVRVDGNDLLAVIKEVSAAAERARKGRGPTLIEGVTYRLGAHSSSDDPSHYRSSEQTAAWEAKDPIGRFARYLERRQLWDADWDQQLRAEIAGRVKEAVKAAEAAPYPPLSTLFDEVYAKKPWHLVEQEAARLALPYEGGGH